MNTPKDIKRLHTKDAIESQFQSTLEKRVDRYLEIGHQDIIGSHYFAPASSQCIYLYRDGYYIASVMMSHSINEGIIKFVAERNSIDRQKSKTETKTIEELIDELKKKHILSPDCADASYKIWKSYRADVHHMNPTVAKINFRELAGQNIKRLSLIEKEIFNFRIKDGAIIPIQTKYWDIGKDGSVPVFLRLE